MARARRLQVRRASRSPSDLLWDMKREYCRKHILRIHGIHMSSSPCIIPRLRVFCQFCQSYAHVHTHKKAHDQQRPSQCSSYWSRRAKKANWVTTRRHRPGARRGDCACVVATLRHSGLATVSKCRRDLIVPPPFVAACRPLLRFPANDGVASLPRRHPHKLAPRPPRLPHPRHPRIQN